MLYISLVLVFLYIISERYTFVMNNSDLKGMLRGIPAMLNVMWAFGIILGAITMLVLWKYMECYSIRNIEEGGGDLSFGSSYYLTKLFNLLLIISLIANIILYPKGELLYRIFN